MLVRPGGVAVPLPVGEPLHHFSMSPLSLSLVLRPAEEASCGLGFQDYIRSSHDIALDRTADDWYFPCDQTAQAQAQAK